MASRKKAPAKKKKVSSKKKAPTKKKVSKKKAPAKKKKKVTKKAPAKKKKAVAKKPLKTFISLVLDRSGSMDPVRAETIEHFNEQAEQIAKDSKGMDTSVSLVTFASHNDVKIHFLNKPVDKLKPLTMKTYEPNGMTAMYDAIGLAIDKMLEFKGIEDKDAAALVVILSDGLNNDSKEFTKEDVAEKIQSLQKTKRWTFSYLGANQDLSKIEKDLKIPKGNMQKFVASADGVKQATTQSVNSIGTYMSSRRAGETSTSAYYSSK